MNGERAFLAELLDDAGLFPPEQLTIAQTIARRRAADGGDSAALLGHVVVPASQLGAFARQGPGDWAVAVVIDVPAVHEGFRAAREAARAGLRIAAIEIPIVRGKGAALATRLDDLCTQLTGAGLGRAELFVEIPLADRAAIAQHVRAIRDAGRDHDLAVLAKIRCGGATVPSPDLLACFVHEAAAHEVAFKATAGLHQPIAHVDGDGFHHGFVNLVGAAVLRFAGTIDEADAAALLADTYAGAFRLDGDGFAWRSFRAAPETIAAARDRLVRSFGTCSLSEPIAGVESLRAAHATAG